MGGQESGRAGGRAESSKLINQHNSPQCAVSFPGHDRESITGAPRLQAALGQETVGKAVVHTKVGSREYGYG